MVMWYWSVEIFFWQLQIDHHMDVFPHKLESVRPHTGFPVVLGWMHSHVTTKLITKFVSCGAPPASTPVELHY